MNLLSKIKEGRNYNGSKRIKTNKELDVKTKVITHCIKYPAIESKAAQLEVF